MDDKVRGRNWKSLSIDLPSSTISLLSDESDETQASLSLASGVHSVVTNVASYATFNNRSLNFILNSEEKLSLTNTGLKTKTVLCLSFLCPCFVLIQKFGYFFHDQHC